MLLLLLLYSCVEFYFDVILGITLLAWLMLGCFE